MVRLESVRMLLKMYHQIVMLFVLSYLLAIWRGSSITLQKPNRYYMENLPFIDNVSREPMFFPTSMYIRAKFFQLCCAPMFRWLQTSRSVDPFLLGLNMKTSC